MEFTFLSRSPCLLCDKVTGQGEEWNQSGAMAVPQEEIRVQFQGGRGLGGPVGRAGIDLAGGVLWMEWGVRQREEQRVHPGWWPE